MEYPIGSIDYLESLPTFLVFLTPDSYELKVFLGDYIARLPLVLVAEEAFCFLVRLSLFAELSLLDLFTYWLYFKSIPAPDVLTFYPESLED